jgi:putative endonuclease
MVFCTAAIKIVAGSCLPPTTGGDATCNHVIILVYLGVKNMNYYTYILRCGDGSLYTGITTDLERRLSEHKKGGDGGAKYTASRGPVEYVAAWTSSDRSAASKLEWRIKALTKAQKERLILDGTLRNFDLTGYIKLKDREERNK